MRRHGGALLSFAIALLAFASPAWAAGTVEETPAGTTVIFTGTGGADQVAFDQDANGLLVSGADITPGAGCTREAGDTIRCGKASLTTLVVNLGDGDDRFANASPFRAQVNAGGGDDSLTPGSGKLADDLHGGGGNDTAHYDNSELSLRITLDDQANDGSEGAGGNVHTDVENLIGGTGNDQLIGDDADNLLDGGPAADEVTGKGGNDTLLGGTGPDVIFAKDGAVDAIDCGLAVDTAYTDPGDTQTDCESAPKPKPGSPAPVTPKLAATVSSKFKAGLRTLVRRLVVAKASAPASIRVSCATKKRGCRFQAKRVAPKSATTSLTKLFRKAKLRPGAVIEIRVTQPGTIGKVFRFTMRKKKKPKARVLCLPPGAKSPSACS